MGGAVKMDGSVQGSFKKSLISFGFWIGTTLIASALLHLLLVFAWPTIGRGVLIDDIMPADENAPRLYTELDISGNQELRNVFRYADSRKDSVYCAFDLRDGAVRIGGELDVPFWSISVHTLTGLVVGSVNHRAASGGRLDLFVMRPALARDLVESGAELPSDTLIVEMNDTMGVVRISGLATYEALRPSLRDALAQTDCELATFSFAAPVQADDDSIEGDRPAVDAGPPSVPSPTPRPVTAPQ